MTTGSKTLALILGLCAFGGCQREEAPTAPAEGGAEICRSDESTAAEGKAAQATDAAAKPGGGKARSFETPCPAQLTPELIQTLQRALAARGLYDGEIDGRMGPRLHQSVRAYQQQQHGIDSEILSLKAARSLGIVAYDRKDL